MYRDTILGDLASRQYNHFIDCFIEIKASLLRRLFFDVITDPGDDVSGSIGIAQDAAEGFPNLTEIRRLLVQKIQSRASVVARGGTTRAFGASCGGCSGELVRDGVSREVITIQGFGETYLLVPTGQGVRALHNRRSTSSLAEES